MLVQVANGVTSGVSNCLIHARKQMAANAGKIQRWTTERQHMPLNALSSPPIQEGLLRSARIKYWKDVNLSR